MATNENDEGNVAGADREPIAGYRRRVIVKFKDRVQLPRENAARMAESLGAGPWSELAAQFPGSRWNRSFP